MLRRLLVARAGSQLNSFGADQLAAHIRRHAAALATFACPRDPKALVAVIACRWSWVGWGEGGGDPLGCPVVATHPLETDLEPLLYGTWHLAWFARCWRMGPPVGHGVVIMVEVGATMERSSVHRRVVMAMMPSTPTRTAFRAHGRHVAGPHTMLHTPMSALGSTPCHVLGARPDLVPLAPRPPSLGAATNCRSRRSPSVRSPRRCLCMRCRAARARCGAPGYRRASTARVGDALSCTPRRRFVV